MQNLPTCFRALSERLINELDYTQLSELIEVWPHLTAPQQLMQMRSWKNRLYWHHHTTVATWFDDCRDPRGVSKADAAFRAWG